MTFHCLFATLLAILIISEAYKSPLARRGPVKTFMTVDDGFKPIELYKSAPLCAMLLPTMALADGADATPVLVPLVISFLTVVPFYFYSQALKPKPRTVQQIELDENLRPKDRSLAKGKSGEATAQKKK